MDIRINNIKKRKLAYISKQAEQGYKDLSPFYASLTPQKKLKNKDAKPYFEKNRPRNTSSVETVRPTNRFWYE